MRKRILIARPAERSSEHAAFARRVHDALVPALLADDPAGLKLTVTERPPPRLSLVPFRRAPVAAVSVWSEGPVATEHPGLRIDAYEVDEAIPRDYARGWPDGEPSPGVNLLTLFSRRPGLDDATFFARWHHGHTPLSLEIHPLWAYVRNVVTRPLDGAPPLDGIVEEQFREPADLLDPRRMFGAGRLGPALWNMGRTAVDIVGFMDLLGMEIYLATEHHVRSLDG
ncbi:MAG TPA: EthD domain-containing protein [Sandaracinaceae bacterium LLY-WYZ-13_1]|nr:EthD domain-containing protein [Sandaracinaceae bacterium LLY-WYZ-13_1]